MPEALKRMELLQITTVKKIISRGTKHVESLKRETF